MREKIEPRIPTRLFEIYHGLKSRVQSATAPEKEIIEGYEELRRTILESARNATVDIRTLVGFTPGDPFFDSLPDILEESPLGVNVRIIVVVPDDWQQDRQIRSDLGDLMTIATERGNAEVRYVTQSDYLENQ